MGLWLGTSSRSIYACLKPWRHSNGRTVGAFRGYGPGDEGSRSRKAKLSGDFHGRGLFIQAGRGGDGVAGSAGA